MMGVIDGVHVAQEGVLVDTAMNILVPLHARNF
jgi:hypothetical protein